MFNWTTTTIINSLTDYKSDLPLIKVWTKPENGAGFSGAYPVLKIKRDHTFEARYISKVYKATANDPKLCEMQIDCSKLVEKADKVKPTDLTYPIHARLAFYVSLEGSEESIYANDWYQKGKPFSIGFDIKSAESAADVAKQIKKNANKFGVVMYGKKIFDISGEGTTLTLKGTHEYQRIKMAAVALDDSIDEILVDSYIDGEVDETGKLLEKSENEVFSLVERGINGFGTYHQLIKDLRLPTVHHNKWLQIQEDEKPVVGAKYNQYIITYCAPSMANPGFTVIGQHNMSVTTHVFWVNQEVAEEFEGYLGDVANIEEVNSVEDGEVSFVAAGVKTTPGENYSANHEQKIVHTESDAEAGKTAKGSK